MLSAVHCSALKYSSDSLILWPRYCNLAPARAQHQPDAKFPIWSTPNPPVSTCFTSGNYSLTFLRNNLQSVRVYGLTTVQKLLKKTKNLYHCIWLNIVFGVNSSSDTTRYNSSIFQACIEFPETQLYFMNVFVNFSFSSRIFPLACCFLAKKYGGETFASLLKAGKWNNLNFSSPVGVLPIAIFLRHGGRAPLKKEEHPDL